jgi:hypothetical protein
MRQLTVAEQRYQAVLAVATLHGYFVSDDLSAVVTMPGLNRRQQGNDSIGFGSLAVAKRLMKRASRHRLPLSTRRFTARFTVARNGALPAVTLAR